MEQKLSRMPVMIGTVAVSILAYLGRNHQLTAAAAGTASGQSWLLPAACILVTVLCGVYARSLRGRKKYGSVSSRSLPLLLVSCAAAVCLLISSVLLAVQRTQTTDLLVAAAGLVTVVCWTAAAMARYLGKRAPSAVFLFPAVFYIVNLICQFRFWMRDPAISDYCYDLFALICTMCAVFHLGGYSFDKGGRRITAFFTMTGVFFSLVALAGASTAGKLGYLGAALWLLVNLWLLLRPGKKKQSEAEA